MPVVEFLQFTLSGVVFGMIYAAVALSLVLIWRGTRLLNYGQGGMAMFTTYVAIEVIYHTGSYWAGFVVALLAGILLGAICQVTIIRPTMNKPPLNAVIVTIGLLVLLEGLAGIFFGGQFRPFPTAFSVAGLLGALAGVLVSPSTFLYPNSMDTIFVFGFTAAVIGGLDSPVGAVTGGLLLGLALSYAGGYLPSGANLVPVVALGILVVVLMVRPDGLFSATQVRRV